MKAIMLINTLSIILGIVIVAHKSMAYPKQQQDHDIGPIQAILENKKTFPLSFLWGGLAIAGRNVLVIIGRRAKYSILKGGGEIE